VTEKIVLFLGEVALFTQLTEEERTKIASVMSYRKVKKKDILFYEGFPCTAIYLLQHGRVKVYKTTEEGREQIVNILVDSDMFPHVGMFGGSPYPATAEALEDSSLYYIKVQELTAMLEGNPALCIRLLQILEGKIRGLQSRLTDVLSKDMREKIINTLLSLARSNGSRIPEGYRIEMELTHQDLASMVGTTRETVSRVISQLKREGKVEFDFHRVVIRD
jgi:CRP/FNR family transcriptional regulator, cyclic AMP receptor protein